MCLLLLAGIARAQEPSPFDKAVAELAACTEKAVDKCPGYKAALGEVENDREKLLQVVEKGGAAGTKAALKMMSRVGGHEGALRTLLGNDSDEIRIGAIGLAANTGMKSLAPDIFKRAQIAREKGPERELLKAVYALGRLKHKEASAFILELTGSPAHKLSRVAAEAVAQLGAEGALEQLLAMARNTELTPRNRKAAIASLGKMKMPEATKALLKFVEKEESGIRRAALRALGDTGDRSIIPALVDLMEQEEMLPALVETLVRIGGEKSSSMLYTLSQDERKDSAIRFKALCAAGKAGSGRALKPLLAELKSSDPSTRTAAIEALGHLKDPTAVAPLFKLFKKAKGQEKQLAHWSIKMASGEALETEADIRSYLEKQK